MKFDLKVLGVAAAMALAASSASGQDVPVAGNWETGPRDYRYQLELCGPSGQDLCGIMTYGLDQSPRVQRYVGKRTFDAARRIGPASWKGDIVFAGYSMNGKITLAEPDRLEIDGCVLLLICGKFNMYREGSDIPR